MSKTPVRPGEVVKRVLLGLTPLKTGELVAVASPTQLHQAYKRAVQDKQLETMAFSSRGRYLVQRTMTFASFYHWLRKARELGLIEMVGTGVIDPDNPESTQLIRFEEDPDSGEYRGAFPKTTLYKLTDAGRDEVVIWENINLWWDLLEREQWRQ